MGKLLGVPEWAAMTAFVVTGLAVWLGVGFVLLRRAHLRTAALRANPTKAEFLAIMTRDVSPDAAAFLWAQTLRYVEPRLTPHPDDDLIKDLCIDGDDIGVDWPQAWAELRGIQKGDLSDWPEGINPTVRNYARWLDTGARHAEDPSAGE